MQGSVNINATDIVVSGHCIPIQARESMEAAAAGLKDATTAEFPDYTLIATHDRRTQYYFTKPSHRLYPWAIATFVAGKYAAPGATNDNPVGVRGTLALPKALSAPATSADAQTVLNWANSRLDALRAEFRIAPPATTTTPLKSSADPAKPSIPS